MLTKPAAVFAQIIGAVIAFLGIGAATEGNWMVLPIGIALFVWGGWSSRERIRRDQQRDDPRRS